MYCDTSLTHTNYIRTITGVRSLTRIRICRIEKQIENRDLTPGQIFRFRQIK
jgi:hypothetical protein